jgi:hypothetical protein
VIDRASRGADGVRLADVNGDGLADVVTPWEEGAVVRVAVHPGPKAVRARSSWPAVTVGRVASPEDAVAADLDGDGALDVVSSCEGATKTVFIHWAPRDRSRILDAAAWRTTPIAATAGKQQWMFALPLQLDGQRGIDLVVGGKGSGAAVGWLRAPADPRDAAAWTYHPLRDAGWIMSLAASDFDGDGDADIVLSDRKGPRRGVFFLENPGAAAVARGAAWREHPIGGEGREPMFLTLADLDGDSKSDVIAATRQGSLLFCRREADRPARWQTYPIDNPFAVPHGKGVGVGDIDGDGRLDLVHSTEKGDRPRDPGVAWIQHDGSPTDRNWLARDISGPDGSKFDLVELADVDGDGDLDVIACEERANLGVFWYENPLKD